MTSPELKSLIASRRDGWALPGEFYRQPQVYRAELDSIWRRQWLFVVRWYLKSLTTTS